MTQNLTTQEVQEVKEVKNQKEVGAMMEAQNVELFEQPIIVSPIVLEEYEETIVEGVVIKVKKMKDYNKEYFDVYFSNYIIRIYGSPYDAKMAIYALLMIEKRLLDSGFVEKIIDWNENERDWEIWDPYRIFIKGEFKIFREGNYKMQEGDALIDLEVRRIHVPSENKLKIYIKAFMMPAPHIE
jgi:hypothetical protein